MDEHEFEKMIDAEVEELLIKKHEVVEGVEPEYLKPVDPYYKSPYEAHKEQMEIIGEHKPVLEEIEEAPKFYRRIRLIYDPTMNRGAGGYRKNKEYLK